MFVGVRASRNQTGKRAAQILLDAGGRAVRAADKSRKGGDNEAWPVYRWVQAGDRWWTDLDAMRETIANNILELTDTLCEPLTAASIVEVVGNEIGDE